MTCTATFGSGAAIGHGEYPEGAVSDPTGSREASNRVVRGGGWFYDAALCRSAIRRLIDPSTRSDSVGFRVALTPREIPKQAEPGQDK